MSNTGGYYDAHSKFTLNEKCSFPQIQPPPGIELETENNEDGTKTIVSFVVTVKKADTEEQAWSIAASQAKRLVDLLAVLSGKHLGYTLSGRDIRITGGMKKMYAIFTHKYNINSQPVDLSQGKFPKLIEALEPQGRDVRLLETLNHANNGLEAAENSLYEVMIKEFYLAMADKVEARKYGPLRDALSHHTQLKPKTIKKLKDNFGKGYFDLPNGKFDHSSAKNIEHLQIQATELMNIAIGYIRKELQKHKSSTP
jgi:ribosomal protein S17E